MGGITNDANIHSKLFISATEAEHIIGVERRTLFKWARAGRLPYVRRNGRGHWRFEYAAIRNLAYDGLNTEQETSIEGHDQGKSTCQEAADIMPQEKVDSRIEAIYARVSTRKQLEHLENQVQSLKAKYPSAIVFRDCASGLNFRRKGLVALLQRVLAGCVQVVHVAYRDRLCRFAYDLVERVFKHHGTTITVEAHDPQSSEHDLADDVLSIITVFSARMYGRRSAGRQRTFRSKGADERKGACLFEHRSANEAAMG